MNCKIQELPTYIAVIRTDSFDQALLSKYFYSPNHFIEVIKDLELDQTKIRIYSKITTKLVRVLYEIKKELNLDD